MHLRDAAQPVEAASFTDDTSLPHVGCRVSIHAQIIREHQISWYFFLKDRTPHNRGEFKDAAIRTFFSLAEPDREGVFKTLRTVRIHIVDPRPYAANLHEALKRHLPKGSTVSDFLNRLDKSTKNLEHFRHAAIRYVATRMLSDSPAERLKIEYQASECTNGLSLLPFEVPAPRQFDLTPFEHRRARLLNDVANFISASASVFTPAIDEFRRAQDDYSFSSPMAAPWLISSALGHSHAFDEGHSHALRWIEEQRVNVLSQLDRHRHFYPEYLPRPLLELISTESVPIQAADIAASIARELWRRNNLPHLVRRFEYVTFNGERLSEARAEQYEDIFRSIHLSN